ncbi:MAG: SpoIID/LytB domain-containing protein, partial [Negativicutes bacterium]|nr:SpoIID/LytB domain-containing protein [Negativicutes bacterium]
MKMSKLTVMFAVVTALVGVTGGTVVAAAGEEPVIGVALSVNQPNLIVASDGGITVFASGKKMLSVTAGQRVTVSAGQDGIAIGGRGTGVDKLRITPDKGNDSGIVVNKKRYRGIIDVSLNADRRGLLVVNRLPLEQYLYGVVGAEISPDWPQEAIKAQAVAARSYTMAKLAEKRYKGYDLNATSDQAYNGMNGEDRRINDGVDATRGVVATCRGKPISAFFFASGGGYTE